MAIEASSINNRVVDNEFLHSGRFIFVPESIVSYADKTFNVNENKFLNLLINLGVLMEKNKVFHISNGVRENIYADKYAPFPICGNTKVPNCEFDQNSYSSIVRNLRGKSTKGIDTWIYRLLSFSLVLPNIDLEIKQDNGFVKFDPYAYFKNSTNKENSTTKI